MARVTVEDCLEHVPNRFALTILASRRARALGESRGRPLVECENKEGVTALREISGEKVRFKEDVEAALVDFIEEQRRQLRVTTGEHTFLEAASLRALEEEELEDEEEVVEEDVEELDTDPETLGKQAKGGDNEDEDEAEVEDEEEVEESSDDFEGDAPFDDEDIPDPEEDDDSSSDDAEDDSDEED